jgi:ribose-phosphate pyrophosphokinase
MNSYLLFSGTSHPAFAQEVANYLNAPLGRVKFEPFPDGEISVQILDNVRGRDVFVIQSIAREPNNYLMELLIMLDALKRASAKSLAVVIPYYGYARQDRKDKPRVPITAKLMANLISVAGATRVLTLDLHAGQIQGFFDIPVDNLYATPILGEAILKLGLKNLVIMAPDLGAIKKARAYAEYLHADFALIDKRRVTSETVEVYSLIGNVKDRDVVLVDDMCSTGGTLLMAAQACRDAGAKRIFAAVTHGLFVGKAIQALDKSPIEKIMVTNSVTLPESFQHPKIEQVSVAKLFGESIRCIISAESISSIFNAV